MIRTVQDLRRALDAYPDDMPVWNTADVEFEHLRYIHLVASKHGFLAVSSGVQPDDDFEGWRFETINGADYSGPVIPWGVQGDDHG
jgi:hypothetical protein